MGKVIQFHLTKRAIYRAAIREINEMYRLSAGGTGPIVDESSLEMFERGEIDEVVWGDWPSYCERIFAKMENEMRSAKGAELGTGN